MATRDNDLFGMMSFEDKLNGDNYPMWAYIMRHVLVATNVWVYVDETEKPPLAPAPADGEVVSA